MTLAVAVDQVLQNLGEVDSEDKEFIDKACVNRYLSAVNGDIKKASAQLKATLAWRKNFKPDNLLTKDLEDIILKEKHYFAGCCSSGHAVMITRKRVRTLPVEEEDIYMRYIVYTADQAIRMMKDSQDRWIWILDLKGYTSSNSPSVSLTLKIVKLLSQHYPERLKKAYIVDAPTVFYVLYKVVYPFLDQPTRDKTCFVYSTHYSNEGELLSGKEDKTNFTTYYNFYVKEHIPADYILKIKEGEKESESTVF